MINDETIISILTIISIINFFIYFISVMLNMEKSIILLVYGFGFIILAELLKIKSLIKERNKTNVKK